MTSTPDIFLSYNREDAATARRFADAFEAQGFKVWWDATLRSGEAYDEVTENALKTAKAVVVLWSKKSVVSRWVRAEATLADRNKTLVPVMIEPCERPIMFELTQTADLSRWQGAADDTAWRAFLADVREFVEKKTGPTQSAVVRTVPAVAPARAASRGDSPSIAVLPFVNMSPDVEQEYFSDGLSEELLNHLAQIKGLLVAGRTSSFSFKGKNEDLRVIGEKLGVNHLLEGSVRKAGSRLRITAQLIDARKGTHLWSQTYDRTLDDVFAIQEGIARAVAAALSITLGVGTTLAEAGGTTNIEAYEKFLTAQAIVSRGSAEDWQQSAQLYRDALAIDPEFARAWRGLHWSLGGVLAFYPERADAIRKERAEASAQMLSLTYDAWWTQAWRSGQLACQGRWSDAEAAASAALQAAPRGNVDALRNYAGLLIAVGRVQDGVEYFRRARDVDPLSPLASGIYQRYLNIAGSWTEADAEYARYKEIGSDNPFPDWFVVVRYMKRPGAEPSGLKARVQAYAARWPNSPAVHLPAPITDLDDRSAVLAAIRAEVEHPTRKDPSRIWGFAAFADFYDDKDLALAVLQRYAALTKGMEMDWSNFADGSVYWQPFKTEVRADPRFKQIVRDLKIDVYWRTSGKWGDHSQPIGSEDFQCK